MDDALRSLLDLSDRLAAADDLEEGLRAITDAALLLLNANHASVRLIDRRGLRASARSGVGASHPAPPFKKGQGVVGWVAKTGKVARVPDVANDPRFEPRLERGFDVGSVLSIPVTVEGKVRGVFSVSAPASNAFGERDEHLGRLLANKAAQALRVAELARLSLTDPQTRAYNCRYLMRRLGEEMRRATRTHEPLSLLLMDLDHFKRVNDEHGHAVGDAVLRAFANTVRESVRGIDVFIRRGGEEFVLIMPATRGERARQVAERIRAKMAKRPLRLRAPVLCRQTVSIGVATWDGQEAPESLDHRADLAMYEAKGRGRDSVVVAAVPAPGKSAAPHLGRLQA